MKIYDTIKVLPITDIKPYWRNPRNNDSTVKALVKIIPQVGFNVPLFIDKDGVIIKGHARYKAAIQLGMTEIPCIISDKTEEENRLDRIADNKISELAEWDITELRYELEQIDFPLEDIGFDVPKMDYMQEVYQPEEYHAVTPEKIHRSEQNLAEKVFSGQNLASNDQESETVMDIRQEQKTDKPYHSPIKIICPNCGMHFVYKG